jgi:hypothetical protein
MATDDDLDALWTGQHHITIRMAEAYRDWATNQGYPVGQSVLAMSMALFAAVDGMHLAACGYVGDKDQPAIEGIGYAAVLSMRYGDKLPEARIFLENALERLDELLKKGAS